MQVLRPERAVHVGLHLLRVPAGEDLLAGPRRLLPLPLPRRREEVRRVLAWRPVALLSEAAEI